MARWPRSPRISTSSASTAASPISTNSPTRCRAAIGEVTSPSDITPDFAWAIREAADILVQLFAPMMPHLAEECWAALGHKTLVSMQPWPEVEPALLVENTITLPVQVNGKKAG